MTAHLEGHNPAIATASMILYPRNVIEHIEATMTIDAMTKAAESAPIPRWPELSNRYPFEKIPDLALNHGYYREMAQRVEDSDVAKRELKLYFGNDPLGHTWYSLMWLLSEMDKDPQFPKETKRTVFMVSTAFAGIWRYRDIYDPRAPQHTYPFNLQHTTKTEIHRAWQRYSSMVVGKRAPMPRTLGIILREIDIVRMREISSEGADKLRRTDNHRLAIWAVCKAWDEANKITHNVRSNIRL